MLSVGNNNKITLTRGDTLTLELTLTDSNGDQYVPDEGDSLRFAISEGYEGGQYYRLKYEQDISTEDMAFTMPASETKKLEYKEYNYDIELTRSDGTVDTMISSQLKITGEVK